MKSMGAAGDSVNNRSEWKRKSIVISALTVLTSSQAILIVWSKRAGKYEYSVTTANFLVETLKCALSLLTLTRIWRTEGVTEDNRLSTSLDEVNVYPIPAALYLVKNLLQYYIFAYVDAPGYQILKNLNIISTGVLYRIILKRQLSSIQWAAFILLCVGCTTAQLNPSSDHVLQTPFQGWIMAVVMALLSGFAGVYTEAIIKKRPSRNINVQNFWLYVFGMIFNAVAIVIQDFDAVVNEGFFHGYSFITVVMIVNHALSGIAVSMVMKYADNIVKGIVSRSRPGSNARYDGLDDHVTTNTAANHLSDSSQPKGYFFCHYLSFKLLPYICHWRTAAISLSYEITAL